MSYAAYSAKTVKVACEKWLAALEKDIAQQKEKLILKAMQPRWFGRTRTREEAIEWLSTSDPLAITDYELAEMTGWRDKGRIEALLALATTAPKGRDEVNLCSVDAYLLKGFL